jgi:hypothetical protein
MSVGSFVDVPDGLSAIGLVAEALEAGTRDGSSSKAEPSRKLFGV